MHLGCEQKGGRERRLETEREEKTEGGNTSSPRVKDVLPNCTDLGQHGGVALSKEKPEGTQVQ